MKVCEVCGIEEGYDSIESEVNQTRSLFLCESCQEDRKHHYLESDESFD